MSTMINNLSTTNKRQINGTKKPISYKPDLNILSLQHANSLSPSNFKTSKKHIPLKIYEKQSLIFLSLNEDVRLQIFSFLSVQSLRSISMTNHCIHSFLCGKISNQFDDVARNSLWIPILRRMYPWLPLPEEIVFRNHRFNQSGEQAFVGMGYGGLLQYMPLNPIASRIDPIFIKGRNNDTQHNNSVEDINMSEEEWNSVSGRGQRSRRHGSQYHVPLLMSQFRNNTNPTGIFFVSYKYALKNKELQDVVQFCGRVGIGDRCIRSDHPFPKPFNTVPDKNNMIIDSDVSNLQGKNHSNDNLSYDYLSRVSKLKFLVSRRKKCGVISDKLFNLLRKPKNRPKKNIRQERCNVQDSMIVTSTKSLGYQSLLSRHISSTILPYPIKSLGFVSPFVSRIMPFNDRKFKFRGTGRFLEINLSPRLVAYYEVSILERDELQESILNQKISRFSSNQSTTLSDCVAVGLSTQSFNAFGFMPGWDIESYGFHGDDGGFFHSKGRMDPKPGPTYGVGDIVGCGVNYENNGIFFTLNGKFLGYAWEKIKDDDLFPTIGVDTNCPLSLNFGSRPFCFDLTSFIACDKSFIPSHHLDG